MNPEVSRRVLKVIAHVQRINVSTINIDTDFETLGMDSFDAISLIFALEEEFDVTLPDEAKDYRRIDDVILGIEMLLNQAVVEEA